MNKRVIELTCGDPKTNQQTASKVDCTITINNMGSKSCKKDGRSCKSDSTESNVRVVKDDSDIYLSDISDVTPNSVRSMPVKRTARVSGIKIQRDVKRTDVESLPTSTEGFVQTGVRATITHDEVLNSIEVKNVLIKAQQRILRENDTLLLHNLLDKSQKIILHLDDLKELVAIVIRLVDNDFSEDAIKVLVYENDVEVGCCGCKKATLVNPFNEISSIIVGKQDFKVHQFEAYTAITEHLNISLTMVYTKLPDKTINADEGVNVIE